MHATIDEAIARVEQLYTTLTGQRPPQITGNCAPIPPESDPLVHVEEQLARLVASVEQLVPTAAAAPAWSPHAISWREAGGIAIAIDIPGVSRDHVQIRVEPWTITVTGQRRSPWNGQERHGSSVNGTDCSEVRFGSFARSFRLMTSPSPEQVSARLDNGVLMIRIAASSRIETSQIPIGS